MPQHARGLIDIYQALEPQETSAAGAQAVLSFRHHALQPCQHGNHLSRDKGIIHFQTCCTCKGHIRTALV